MTATSTCANCRTAIGESEEVRFEDRIPCPECGSTSRLFARELSEHTEIHETLRIKAKRQGKGKPFLEAVSGESLNRDTGRWLKIEQVVDRENNRYRKKLVDPSTGEVLRDDDVPLTEHRGFGSAAMPNDRD